VKREPMWGRLVRLAPYSHKVRALVNLIAPGSMTNADAVGLLSSGNGHFPRPEPAVRLTDAERGACGRIAAYRTEHPDKYRAGLAHFEHMAGLYREAGDQLKAAVFAGMAAETRRIAGGISESAPRPVKPSTRWQTVEAD
jgi:hypothetical protein